MALKPPRAKDVAIATGAGYQVKVDNADGQAVVEVVVTHQNEDPEGRGNVEAALKAVRSDLGVVNFILGTATSRGKSTFLKDLAPGDWSDVDPEVELLPDDSHPTIDRGALQATAGLTLPSLTRFLKNDPTLAEGLHEAWKDKITPEISEKLIKPGGVIVGSAAETSPNLWPTSEQGMRTYLGQVGAKLPDNDIDDLTSIVVSLVRLPIRARSGGKVAYYKILAGNLLHKTDLASMWALFGGKFQFINDSRDQFIDTLLKIISEVSGVATAAQDTVIPKSLAGGGQESRLPVLGLTLQRWYETILKSGIDLLKPDSYPVGEEWKQHKEVRDVVKGNAGAPPIGWRGKEEGSLDSLENVQKRLGEALEGFGDLAGAGTDSGLHSGDDRRPVFEFRSIGKDTSLANLPNTALAMWDLVNIALGQAAAGPETEATEGANDDDNDPFADLMKLPSVSNATLDTDL